MLTRTLLALNGVVVLRGALPVEIVRRLAALASCAYLDIESGGGSDIAREAVAKWGGIPLSAYSLDLQTVMPHIVNLTRDFASHALFIEESSVIRRHMSIATYTEWHIDADGAGTYTRDPCLNIWVPFAKVGTDLPSIEFLCGSHRKMRLFPLFGAKGNRRTDEFARAHFRGATRLAPELEPGDVAVFDHYLLHRTQPIAHAGTRMSAEFRFHSPCPSKNE